MPAKAKESSQIKRAREKLKKQLEAADKQINEKALLQMGRTIENWLHRHSNDRLELKERPFTMFDENEHPAKTESKFVLRLLKKIKSEAKASKSLEGRIKASKPSKQKKTRLNK